MRDLPPLQTIPPDDYRRIREVFEAALERPPGDRLPFVERECESAPHILNEVKRMLAADGQTHAIIDPPPLSPRSQAPGPAACASCGAPLTATQKFCPECGTPAGGDREGRFRAGALFANRFRIVAALGRGGMGEVYRAHDLELGQPVALKFLTALRSAERARQRLRTEVRLARQLAHPNVCRVYDIGEANGELYLSMEYVDGEDLAALLKRIGRVPVDKGIEIARKLCAGLAAAHAKGVLHRDLKPANIMLDGSGEVRLMDFGIAAVASELDAREIRSGTPAYMAPEQLAGRETTIQSDIYALGLVLYELFTGKMPFDARDPNELQRQRESHPSTAPATLIPELGSRVEQAIIRCLDPDPKRRPASALDVSAALPGGDPLADALAAGETPSPEMVAAAGTTDAMRPAAAVAWLLTALLSLGVLLWLTPKLHVLSYVSLEQDPSELRVRARDTIRALGYSAPAAYSESRFGYEFAHLSTIQPERRRPSRDAVARSIEAGPSPLYFTYEQSPTPMVFPIVGPSGPTTAYGAAAAGPGLVSVDLDPRGRLRRLVAIPTKAAGPDAQPETADWDIAFKAAGLERSRFTSVTPTSAPVLADTSVAWKGTFPSPSNTPVVVEGASLRGQITEFEVRFPWSGDRRRFSAPPSFPPRTAGDFLNIGIQIGLAFLAWANWKRGRADVRSAMRLGIYAGGIGLAFTQLVGASTVPALALAAFFFTVYLAVEPWSRRFWPHAMVTWTRVLSGRFRDPLVGRDVLIVAACVTFHHALQQVIGLATGWFLSPAAPDDFGVALESLLGGRMMIATMIAPFQNGIFVGITWFAVVLLAKSVVKKTWLAALIYLLVLGIGINGYRLVEGDWQNALLWACELVFLVSLSLRLGLFAASLFSTLSLLIDHSVLTNQFGAWYGQSSLVATVVLIAIALYGFHTALGGRLPVLAQEQSV